MEFVAALILLGLILFVIAGNKRYPGHPASEWMTPGQWIVVLFGVVAALYLWLKVA